MLPNYLKEERAHADRVAKLKALVDDGKMPEDLFNSLCYGEMSGFMIAPASTKHHGCYPGGLFDHSFTMYEYLQQYTDKLGLIWDNPMSPAVVAFCHDFCKYDCYKPTPNGDNPYEYDNTASFHGHGFKSVVLAQKVLKLTDEEINCILYHMGAYEKDRWNEFDKAIKKYPNVLYTHVADMAASKLRGI